MNIEQKLSLYPHIGEEIKNLNDQLIGILDNKYNVTITSKLNGMPGSGAVSDPTYTQVEKIFNCYDQDIEKISSKIMELNTIHREICNALLELDYPEKKIIELRYFKKYRNWDMIWPKVGYQKSQGFVIYNNTMKKITKKIKSPD